MSETPLDRLRAIVADESIGDGRFVEVDCEDFCEAMQDGPDGTEFLTKLWNAADGDLRSPNKHFIPSAGDLRAAIREYDAFKAAGATAGLTSSAGGPPASSGSGSSSTSSKSKP